MKKRLLKKNWLLQVILLVISFLLLSSKDIYAQVGLQLPQPPLTVRLFQPESPGLTNFSTDSLLFKSKPTQFKRVVTMDSIGKFVSVSESVDQTEFVLPAVVDLETYIQLRLEFDRKELWRRTFREQISRQEEAESGAIELDIPIRIKNETFTRIFGSDRVGLRVTGNISFDLSGRSEERSGAATSATQNQGSFSPRFSQTQQFTIEGKIGEKVTVSVEQNSEATFDFENTIQIRYDGDDDEIVQSIEAGNIGLSLPSTKYVIFGGSNKGLFGIKTNMQVGNFYFTGIASLEKGEQQKLTISGSASESQTTVRDYEFMKNRYFFVDQYYLDYYESGWTDDLSNWLFVESKLIRDIDVYISTTYSNVDKVQGLAVLNPNDPQWANLSPADLNNIQTDPGKVERKDFKRLVENQDYTYDYARGFFWLNQSVRDNEVLAVAYRTDEGQVGTLFENLSDSSAAPIFRLIKPQSMKPSDVDTWPLMMRNVYSLGGSNIEKEGFDLRVEYNLNGDHETIQQVEPRETFLYLMGLDRKDQNGSQVEGGDKVIDDNSLIINRGDGILIFPSVRPFQPADGSAFEIDTSYHVDIYNTNNQTDLTQATKFDMIVTSKSTKSTFDLGFNVLEGSEEVLLNGVPLARDRDYLIDYFTGSLTLLSPEAKRGSANLEIKYERATIFQLDKKTILGGRAEYRFWEDSFIGFTMLYLNKTTLDQRVRVGQEPFRNLVWDVNAALKFKPTFLTKAIDALPLVETNEQSTLDIETEFAQVLPNPNTLNNDATGDNNGVAYIDDFEGSKRTTPLGIRYLTWTPASPPAEFPGIGQVNKLDAFNNKANIVWYNPFDQVLITDIWPNRDVNAQTGRTTDVLACQVWRDADLDPDSAWAGFMRSTYSFANQEKTKFIEFWVKALRDTGRIHIDVGRISEDWWLLGSNHQNQPSIGNLNTEDKNSNGILDEGEDTGIDGTPNSQQDPSWPDDRWIQPDRTQVNGYDYINGTEGNSQARGASYPDSEDLDGDGQASLINEYFEYSVSLDPNDPESQKWISGSTDKGWRQFRIPMEEWQKKVGNPDTTFQQVYFVRVWFDQLGTERNTIFFATLDFVGNEWEEQGIAETDTSKFVINDSLFSISVYNTEENAEEIPGGPERYHSPPGVSGIKDRITEAISKEQSIVFRTIDLQPGARAEAKKTLYGNVLSIVNYKRLRMFVHGDQWLPGSPVEDTSNVQIYIKFGSDDNNYYEYGQKVYAHWYSGNEFDIDLDDLTQTKNEELNLKNKRRRDFNDDVGRYYQVSGNPSLNTIRYFIVGIKNTDNIRPFTGEVWLDELRVSDVRQESGTALRLRTSLKAADLFTFNGEWESKDADFHDIKTQFGSGSTIESQSYSGKLNFDKFLPETWNMSVQIDGTARFNKKIPKYYPRTDILTHYKNNTVGDKLKSLFGLKKLDPELEKEVNFQKNYGIGSTIKRRSKSDVWYLYYTIDQINYDFDYSYSHARSYETEFNISERYKQSISYSVPFGKNNYFQPFSFLGNKPIISELSEQKLYFTPTNTNMSLTVTDNKSKQKRRNEDKLTNNVTTNSIRSIRIGYRLLPSVNLNYSRQHKASADFVGLKGSKLLESIFTKFYFGKETDIDQSFQMDYKPNIINWLTTDYSYNADFRYNFVNLNKNQKSSSSRTSKRATFSFSPSQVANMIYTPDQSSASKPTNTRRGRRRRPARGQEKPGDDEQGKQSDDKQKQEDDEEKETESIKIPNPLMLFYSFFDAWKQLQFNYTWDENITHSYVSSIPSWKYQFGLTKNTGVPQDTSITNYAIGPTMSDKRSLRTSLNFDIIQNVRTTFKHEWSVSENRSDKSRTGNEDISFLAWGDDPMKDFKGISSDFRRLIPDWTVQISGVEKFLFFGEFAKSMSVEHGRSGKYSENKKLVGTDLVPATQSFTHNYQPLIGLNISWIWGFSSNIRLNQSSTFNFTTGGGATKSNTSSFTISASYATSGGFKIPIPIWPFKGQTFKNEMNFTLTYDQSTNTTFQRQANQESFQENQKNSSWKLRPSATYRFNKRVSGSMFYEMGSTENKISGKYSYNEFGITVNIAIRD